GGGPGPDGGASPTGCPRRFAATREPRDTLGPAITPRERAMPTEVRRTNWLIRLMLIVGFGFVTFDFIELTFLTGKTDEFFSWTIAASITAAVFGSFYFAASAITLSAFPQRAWARARPAVPGTFALVVLIELATLYHFGPVR